MASWPRNKILRNYQALLYMLWYMIRSLNELSYYDGLVRRLLKIRHITNYKQEKCRNIMIIFIWAHYNQNAYSYMYAYIRYPKVFTSLPHTPTTISVHHFLIKTFLPTTLRNDNKILISVNSEQDVLMSGVLP